MASIILNDKRMTVFFLQSKIKQKCPFLPPLFNIMLKVLASAIRQGKEMRCIQIRKEEMKPPLFVNDMVFYIFKKKTQGIYKNLQKLTNSSSSQDIRSTCKNQLHFLYILVMRIWKLKFKAQSHLQLLKKK